MHTGIRTASLWDLGGGSGEMQHTHDTTDTDESRCMSLCAQQKAPDMLRYVLSNSRPA